MKFLPMLTGTLLVLSVIPCAHATAQSESIRLAPFRSVELRHGGKVVLRHGPTQRVTFLKGSPDYTRVTIAAGDELVIDKCRTKCARGYELELEITSPALARVSVAEGGTLRSRGDFPRQAEIDVTVHNGGTVDIRSMPVSSVTASVVSGGRIFAKPLTTIVASVVQGGLIRYWGDARVTQSIEHGGVIERGTAADAEELPEEAGDVAPTVPPIPPTPPAETSRRERP